RGYSHVAALRCQGRNESGDPNSGRELELQFLFGMLHRQRSVQPWLRSRAIRLEALRQPEWPMGVRAGIGDQQQGCRAHDALFPVPEYISMMAATVAGIWAKRFMLDSIWKPPQIIPLQWARSSIGRA